MGNKKVETNSSGENENPNSNMSIHLNNADRERLKTLPYLDMDEIKRILSLQAHEPHQEMHHLQSRIELLILSSKYKKLLYQIRKEKEQHYGHFIKYFTLF
jgi:hypothetical protein